MNDRYNKSNTLQRCWELFSQLDDEGRHWLDAAQVRRALAVLGRDVTCDEAQRILVVADTTKTGQLLFTDFVAIYSCIALLRQQFRLSPEGQLEQHKVAVDAASRDGDLRLDSIEQNDDVDFAITSNLGNRIGNPQLLTSEPSHIYQYTPASSISTSSSSPPSSSSSSPSSSSSSSSSLSSSSSTSTSSAAFVQDALERQRAREAALLASPTLSSPSPAMKTPSSGADLEKMLSACAYCECLLK
jgi:hypothetical protein